jgi:hypothetical protein
MALKFDMGNPSWHIMAGEERRAKMRSQMGSDVGYAVASAIGGIKKKADERWGKKYNTAMEKFEEEGGDSANFPDPKEWKQQAKKLLREKKRFAKLKKRDEGFAGKLDEAWAQHVTDTAGMPTNERGTRADFEAEKGMDIYDNYQSGLEAEKTRLFDEGVEERRGLIKDRKAKRKAWFGKLFQKKPTIDYEGETDVSPEEQEEHTELGIGETVAPYSDQPNVPTIQSNIEQEQGYTMGEEVPQFDALRGMPKEQFQRLKIDSPLGGYMNQMVAENPLPYPSKLKTSTMSREDADKAFMDAHLAKGSSDEFSDEQIEANEAERRYNLSDEERWNEEKARVFADPNAPLWKKGMYNTSYNKFKRRADSQRDMNQKLIRAKESLQETGEFYTDKLKDPEYNPFHSAGTYLGDKMYDFFNPNEGQ